MADEDLYCAQPQHGPLDEPGAAEHQVMQTPMNAKLTDNDPRSRLPFGWRRAVSGKRLAHGEERLLSIGFRQSVDS